MYDDIQIDQDKNNSQILNVSENDHFLNSLLNPRSIAIYGANENFMYNMGSQHFLNLIDNGYKGKIYPIHLKLNQILGLKTYKSIAEVPEIPDLAVVVLNVKIVNQIFIELGEKGVKNVVLITAGYKETNNINAEFELKKIADKYGIRFIGPNCLGFLNTHAKYTKNPEETCICNTTLVPYNINPGNVSIISQSGCFAAHGNFFINDRDLRISKSISIGNEANIDIYDCLEYFEDDPTTDVIGLYVEEFKRGRKFVELLKRITPKKPIIALYAGETEAGTRAISSHTGSLGAESKIINALFEQTGVIKVNSYEELLDTASVFGKIIPNNAIPMGKKVGIVTIGGGPGAVMSDMATKLGLEVPLFSEELQDQLRKKMPHTAQGEQVANPLDYTFAIDPATQFKIIPKLLAKSGEIDAIAVYGCYSADFYEYNSIGKEIHKSPKIIELKQAHMASMESLIKINKRVSRKYNFPMIYVNFCGKKDRLFSYLNENGVPCFRMLRQAIISLNNLMKYGEYLRKIDKSAN